MRSINLSRETVFGLCAALLMLATLASPILAAPVSTGNSASGAGGNLFDTLQGAVTGNIGFFIGLAITVLGLWTWIVKQETGAGIVMIIGGVMITLVPGIFNGMRNVADGILTTFGGNTTQVMPGSGSGGY